MHSVFCKNLKYLRKIHKLSQEQLSYALGYSSKNLSKWENGLSIPNIETLNKIAEIFNINSIDRLLFDDKLFSKESSDDFKMIAQLEYDISSAEVEFYYYLLENRTVNSNEAIDIPNQMFNANFIFKVLNKFKGFNILDSFEVIYKDDKTSVSYKYSKLMNTQTEKSRPSLYKMLNRYKFYCSKQISQKQFDDFVAKEKIGNQALLILSIIFEQKVVFTLNEMYKHEELYRRIQTQYNKNKDYKKIIRSNLSIISDYGLIVKIGKGVYRRKIIVNQSIDLVKDLLITDLKFDFNKSVVTKKLDVSFKDTVTIENIQLIIDTINDYLTHKVSLNIIDYYDIHIINEKVFNILKSDIRVFLNIDLEYDCVVYYK